MKQVEFVKCDSGLVLHYTAAELHGFTDDIDDVQRA